MLRNGFRYYTKGGMKSTKYGMGIALRIRPSDNPEKNLSFDIQFGGLDTGRSNSGVPTFTMNCSAALAVKGLEKI
jgi:hypothetical protein